MKRQIRVLIVEDSPDDCELVLLALRRGGIEPVWARVETADELMGALSSESWDAVLSDHSLPMFSAAAALALVRTFDPDLPFLVVSGTVGEDIAVGMMRAGAHDYFLKHSLTRLAPAVEREVREAANRRILRESETAVRQLAAIVSDSDFAIISQTLDGIVVSWNAGAERLYGYTAEEMIGKSVSILSQADRSDESGAARERIERGEHVSAFDTVRLHKNGQRLDVSLSFSPIRNVEGRVVGVSRIATNISERKRAEEALRRSEERYRTLIEATSAIVWSSPPSGEFETEQPSWAAFTGQTSEQHRGVGWLNVIHPDDCEKSARAWTETVKNRSMLRLEHRVRRSDGEYRDMSVRAVPIFDGEGAIREWVGVHTDVTDKRRSDHERIALLAQLTLQIERMPLAYLLTGPDLRYTRWNPAAERMFGFTEAEALGKNPFECIIPQQSKTFVEGIFARLLAGDMHAHGVSENVTKDGRTITCEWHNTPLLGPDGTFKGLLSLAQDVTTRKQAEQALQLRDRAIQAATQGLLITDSFTSDDPIVYVSPGFERITGYTSKEAIGRNCRFLQGKDTDSSAVARLRDAIRSGEPCTAELLNYRKDGVSFWNQLSLSPVRNAAGLLTHFVGVLADVTDRRSLENQFHQSQKMEAFGQLAGGVAHDFNNLLTIINGYSELLLQNMSARDPSRAMIVEIFKAGERSAGLTRQLLAFSRQSMLAPRVLDLNSVVGDTDKMLRRLIGEDIRLTTSLDSKLWAVRADPGQIEQVLMNLAVNARDSMPQGGRLTIETHNSVLDETYAQTHPDARAGRYVVVSVTDTGKGITPEVLARIFEPFFTTKGPGKGTGLGLATVYGIVKQSGGHVTVYSEVGIGTSFKVYLPQFDKPTGDAVIRDGIKATPKGTETILLAEDETSVRTLTRLILTALGYTVIEAKDGVEATRLAAEYTGSIHLLITDVVMPGPGGRLVAEEVVTRHPEAKVLFISGYTDDAVIRHGVLREGVNFLQKPFTQVSLALKVRELLDAPAK